MAAHSLSKLSSDNAKKSLKGLFQFVSSSVFMESYFRQFGTESGLITKCSRGPTLDIIFASTSCSFIIMENRQCYKYLAFVALGLKFPSSNVMGPLCISLGPVVPGMAAFSGSNVEALIHCELFADFKICGTHYCIPFVGQHMPELWYSSLH